MLSFKVKNRNEFYQKKMAKRRLKFLVCLGKQQVNTNELEYSVKI